MRGKGGNRDRFQQCGEEKGDPLNLATRPNRPWGGRGDKKGRVGGGEKGVIKKSCVRT